MTRKQSAKSAAKAKAAAAPAKTTSARKKTAPVRVKAAAPKAAPVRVKAAAPKTAAAASPDRLYHEVSQLLYRQSEYLDAKAWQDYIDLFDGAGLYWMPPGPEYTTWEGMPAIFVEDKDLMTVRMKRITHPNAWSQQAEWATNHVVSNVVIEDVAPGGAEIRVRSRFHMLELRRDDLRHFAGTYRHHLLRGKDGALRIKLQRVDMVNAQAPYEYVLQAWV
jgi:benzoate/toluate 1,2-dioxygenase beta subunit